jgi:creatine kinase/arginine kinase
MQNYPKFSKDNSSLLAKYLKKEVFEQLKSLKTPSGFTLEQAIKSGIDNPDSGIGVYAGDLESYKIFEALFNPIIEDYHHFSVIDKHNSNLDSSNFNGNDLDPDNKYILSTRIRVGRNLANFPLGTMISKAQRDEVEQLVSQTLQGFEGELSGNYYPLYQMDAKTKNKLIEAHFLFKNGDRFLESAGLNRDWPAGRGIFHNTDKTFLVWINEEDQLRIISMQKGGDIKAVFERLVKAIKALEAKMNFMYDARLGYISSCPTNLGTAMRASVHIKLPNLANNNALFEAITKKNHLQIRGIHGEHSASESGIFDISNKRRLGITEVRAIEDLYFGVQALIEAEKNLK